MKIGGIEFEPIKCELIPWYKVDWEEFLNIGKALLIKKKEYPIVELTEGLLTWEIIVNYECNL